MLMMELVKFTDKESGLECDLSVNERLSIANSDLIKCYCDISPVLRPMLFSIKEWAKPLRLNCPSTPHVTVSFSSYAFALMTIGFLQVRSFLQLYEALFERYICLLDPRSITQFASEPSFIDARRDPRSLDKKAPSKLGGTVSNGAGLEAT